MDQTLQERISDVLAVELGVEVQDIMPDVALRDLGADSIDMIQLACVLEEEFHVCIPVSSKWAKGSGGPAGDEAYNLVTHALSAEGADASEDGTGRGTPLVVTGHDTGQGWWNESEIAGTLRSEGENRPSRPSNIVAFSSKDQGADAGLISPTLRSMNFDASHINGGGQVAIAFHENKSGQITEAEVSGLRAGASHSYQGVGGNFGVRRLTPRECERLQGFPDDWTRYDSEGKEISDSARYRMLGNAVAVPCAKWIGERIINHST